MTKFHSSMSEYRDQDEASNLLNNEGDVINYEFDKFSNESVNNYEECDSLRFRHQKKKFLKNLQVNNNNDNDKFHITECKSDSGYSESVGFDSLSPVQNEIDTLLPPPLPPIRDASSCFNNICYESTHERYLSWPNTGEYKQRRHSSSDKSKLWIEHANNKKGGAIADCTRFVPARSNAPLTQPLNTVMEKYEKRPVEVFKLKKNCENNKRQAELSLWPQVDCETESFNDAEYVVPSPVESEQHQSVDIFNPLDVETYVQNCRESKVTCYRDTPQEIVDINYLKIQHSQQASYAQSEGYHSYVSSTDSTTNTPFLDRLRRDSEAMPQKSNISTWEDTSVEGRDSVVTTSSRDSASSSETLKWHGSLSDVSVSSSNLQAHNWAHGHNNSCVSGISQEYRGANNNFKKDLPATPDDHKTIKKRHYKLANEPVQAISSDSNNGRLIDLNCSKNLLDHINGKDDASIGVVNEDENWKPNQKCLIGIDQGNVSTFQSSSKQLIAHSSRVQTPQRYYSESILYLDSQKRSQQKFNNQIVGTGNFHNAQIEKVSATLHHHQSNCPSLPQKMAKMNKLPHHHHHNQIIKKEKDERVRYTYLDPEKRHRVSDPTLKAIQKKALLSFYERHHQSFHHKAEPLPSPPPQPPPRPNPPCSSSSSSSSASRRASSASDYSSTSRRNNKINQHNNSIPLSPKHRHSNSCGSLSNDFLGPMIIGSPISIDDWVPARPPKKPHLRSIYNERLPSPDLPPPSPPTVIDDEVFNSDDPLPSPPPELRDNFYVFEEENINCTLMHSSPIQKAHDKDGQILQETSTTNGNFYYKTCHSFNRKTIDLQKLENDYHRPFEGLHYIHSVDNNGAFLRNARQLPMQMKQNNDLNANSLTLGQTPQPQVPKNNSPPMKLDHRTSSSRLGDYNFAQVDSLKPPLPSPPPPPPPLPSPPPLVPRQMHDGNFHCETQEPLAHTAPVIHRQGRKSSHSVSNYEKRPMLDTAGNVENTVLTSMQFRPRPPYLEHGNHISHQTPSHHYEANSEKFDTSVSCEPLKFSRNLPVYYQKADDCIGSKEEILATITGQATNEQNFRSTRKLVRPAPVCGKKSPMIFDDSDERYSSDSNDICNSSEREMRVQDQQMNELTLQEVSDGMSVGNEILSQDQPEKHIDNDENLDPCKFLSSANLQIDVNSTEEKSCELQICPIGELNEFDHMNHNTMESKSKRQSLETENSPSDNPEDKILSFNSTEKAQCELEICSHGNSNFTMVNHQNSSSQLELKESKLSCEDTERKIEGLTLLQRTEVVVRINPTLDVASQTDNVDNITIPVKNGGRVISMPRRQLPEEIECEELSKNLVSQLGPNDELISILIPDPEHKRPADYVSDLFGSKTTLPLRLKRYTSYSPAIHNASVRIREKAEEISTFESDTATYVTIPECKAKIVGRYSDHMKEDQAINIDNQSSRMSGIQNPELQQKKEELMLRLDRKILVLRAEQEAIREEDEMNEALGAKVATRMSAIARPAENSKFRLHVEEVGKITSLLLSLSGRLARVENALSGMSTDHPGRKILESKRNKLLEQLEEAKVLKANIDKRSLNVLAILSKYLNDDEFADYQHFINMKTKLLMDSRELHDKVELGEEQLSALKKAIG